MTREIGDIVRQIRARRGGPLALATLVATRGSSYRLPGARLLISNDGRATGALSGGCLEDEVIEKARQVIHTGRPILLTFDTRQRFGCHGEMTIFVERAKAEFLDQLAQQYGERRPLRIFTQYEGLGIETGTRLLQDDEIEPPNALVHRIEPPIQFLAIGHGPDSTPLRQMAETMGWHWRCVERAAELPQTLDEWTAVLIKTHNYGRDFEALRLLLPSPVRYIGLMGPRKRREQLLCDLFDIGIGAGQNLYAPAGQNLGGDSPESIALAVVAEIHAVFADRPGNHLRDRRTPIHQVGEELRKSSQSLSLVSSSSV